VVEALEQNILEIPAVALRAKTGEPQMALAAALLMRCLPALALEMELAAMVAPVKEQVALGAAAGLVVLLREKLLAREF